MRNYIFSLIAVVLLLSIFGCGKKYSPEQEKYIATVEQDRLDKDDYLKNDPNSPFNYKGGVEFHPLKYFDVDPAWVFESKLIQYDTKDTVSVFGTKGEERKAVRFAYVTINYEGKDYNINVYQGATRSGEVYYSIWFTDRTTNKESYGVGRYLDFELVDDPNYEYTIDFNQAYSPYCSYSPNYSCAIPTKEDYIDIAITAGEKKFHD